MLYTKNPIVEAVKSEDVGGFVFNKQRTILNANDLAHKVFQVDQDYLYGKPLGKVIRAINCIDLASDSLDIDHHIDQTIERVGKVVVADIHLLNCRFLSVKTGWGKSICLSMFYVEDRRNDIGGCFFVEKTDTDNFNSLLDKFIELNNLKNYLSREINRQEIDYRLMETYSSLIGKWKNIALGLGSVVILTTSILSLFVSGLMGSKFGSRATDYYDRFIYPSQTQVQIEPLDLKTVETDLVIQSE